MSNPDAPSTALMEQRADQTAIARSPSQSWSDAAPARGAASSVESCQAAFAAENMR
jgi:hypothetical protein